MDSPGRAIGAPPNDVLRCRARLAAAGRRHRHAVGGIFVELVAQRADRDAQHIGGMGAVAEQQCLSVSRIKSRSTSATVRPTSAREICSEASVAWATDDVPRC